MVDRKGSFDVVLRVGLLPQVGSLQESIRYRSSSNGGKVGALMVVLC